MKVLRTKPDSCREDTDPPIYQNDVTHWWDGSQLYGSDIETHKRVRSFAGGKLIVDDNDGLLPVDPKTNIDVTGKTLVIHHERHSNERIFNLLSCYYIVNCWYNKTCN